MKKAFTLIEIMIVVAIIAILASMLLPQYSAIVERSREAEGASIASALQSAMMRYYYEKNYVYPTGVGDLDIALPDSKYFSSHPSFNGGCVAVKRLANNSKFGQYCVGSCSSGKVLCVANAGTGVCPGGLDIYDTNGTEVPCP